MTNKDTIKEVSEQVNYPMCKTTLFNDYPEGFADLKLTEIEKIIEESDFYFNGPEITEKDLQESRAWLTSKLQEVFEAGKKEGVEESQVIVDRHLTNCIREFRIKNVEIQSSLTKLL